MTDWNYRRRRLELTRKEDAFQVAGEILKHFARVDEHGKQYFYRLKPGEVYIREDLPGVMFYGSPIVKMWDKKLKPIDSMFFSHLLADRNDVIPTPIGRKIGRQKKIFRIAKRLVKEIASVDHDIYDICLNQLKNWKDMVDKGFTRSTFQVQMWLARLIMSSPRFSTYGVKKYSAAPVTPRGISGFKEITDVLIKNPAASAGYPFLRQWRKLTDRERSWIYTVARRLRNQLLQCGNDMKKLMSVIDRWKHLVMWVGARSQGRGRVIINFSKILNFVIMSVIQPYQWKLTQYDWFFLGNHGMKVRKCQMLVKKPVGSFVLEGDDEAIKVYHPDDDGKKNRRTGFFSADDSGFDHGVKPMEKSAAIGVVCRGLTPNSATIYRNVSVLCEFVPKMTPFGMMETSPWYGVDSGGGDTKVITSIVQGMRAANARPFFRRSMDEGISFLNLVGEFRGDDQIFTETAFTVCQLIYSINYPTVLCASVARTLRNIYQQESYTRFPMKPDATLVLALAPLYGHFKFEDTVRALSEFWDVRTPSKALVTLCKKAVSTKNGQTKAKYEGFDRKAINAVINVLTS